MRCGAITKCCHVGTAQSAGADLSAIRTLRSSEQHQPRDHAHCVAPHGSAGKLKGARDSETSISRHHQLLGLHKACCVAKETDSAREFMLGMVTSCAWQCWHQQTMPAPGFPQSMLQQQRYTVNKKDGCAEDLCLDVSASAEISRCWVSAQCNALTKQ